MNIKTVALIAFIIILAICKFVIWGDPVHTKHIENKIITEEKYEN